MSSGCGLCGVVVEVGRQFCSRQCSGASRKVVRHATCEHCKRDFAITNEKRGGRMVFRFCSRPCADATKRYARKPCATCGASTPQARSKFCSRACFGAARRVAEPKWTHPARIAERRAHHAAWRRAHPERIVNAQVVRRRGFKYGAGLSDGEWERIKADAGYCCLCCRKAEPDIKLTVDHIVPISKGGAHEPANIQPLCHSCNSKKRTTVIDYRVKGAA